MIPMTQTCIKMLEADTTCHRSRISPLGVKSSKSFPLLGFVLQRASPRSSYPRISPGANGLPSPRICPPKSIYPELLSKDLSRSQWAPLQGFLLQRASLRSSSPKISPRSQGAPFSKNLESTRRYSPKDLSKSLGLFSKSSPLGLLDLPSSSLHRHLGKQWDPLTGVVSSMLFAQYGQLPRLGAGHRHRLPGLKEACGLETKVKGLSKKPSKRTPY
ncbi:hypothetical protein Acr_22g0006020 [Actinidia rufa]|uniref:Uncharacterized protein n=1 Tax=Actinidia rufa TaxID=165716 RepID=A0A7J0GKF9_9ERIC|nr:hypothetical protein Acr_22g0006020 [Actinidia rufa]